MLKVYQCEACNKTILSKEPLNMQGWKELVPGSVDASMEKHVPVVAQEGDMISVNVGSVTHPMSEEHLIEWIAVETEKGYQVKYLKASDTPIATFRLTDEDKAVAVYAYCNLHGLWRK